MRHRHSARTWILQGLAFGSAIVCTVCLLPPIRPLEDDLFILFMVGLVAYWASDIPRRLLGDRGLAALTVVLLLIATLGAVPAIGHRRMQRLSLCLAVAGGGFACVIWSSRRDGRRRRVPTQRLTAKQPAVAERIGPYLVLDRIAQGGAGVVYRARAPDGKLVALKVLRPELADDPRFLAWFRQEVTLLRRVPRRSTAPIIDSDLEGSVPYLVMEYAEGPTLQQVIDARGPLPEARLENVATGVAAALTAFHEVGVVHRDLKPTNIILTPGVVVVVDFGIARVITGTSSLTREVDWKGTPPFMAPEQFTGGPITPATDIFAWGSVAVFAAAGRPPFHGGTITELAAQIMHGDPNLEGLNSRIQPLVEAALQKNPDRRPSAHDLLRRLYGL